MAHIYIFIMQEKKGCNRPVFADLHWLLSQQAKGSFQQLYQTELLAWTSLPGKKPLPQSLKNEGCLDHEGTYRPRNEYASKILSLHSHLSTLAVTIPESSTPVDLGRKTLCSYKSKQKRHLCRPKTQLCLVMDFFFFEHSPLTGMSSSILQDSVKIKIFTLHFLSLIHRNHRISRNSSCI